MRVTPAIIASWALGGFYFSLMPALVRVATGVTLPVIGDFVISTLTLSGATTMISLRSVSPSRMLSGGIVALAGVADADRHDRFGRGFWRSIRGHHADCAASGGRLPWTSNRYR